MEHTFKFPRHSKRISKMVDVLVLAKEVELSERQFKTYKYITPTIKKISMGRGDFVEGCQVV